MPRAPLATAPSNDKATNTGISATTIYKESTSKIYVKRNNEMIALEIVGDGQVKINEETKDEIQTVEKGVIDFKEIKKQEKYASGFFVGPSLGLDIATMYFSAKATDPIFNKFSTFSASLGYLFGVSGGYDFNRKLGIQSAIHFSRLNFGFVQPDNDNINRGELSIFQIEIPFLLRYKWNFELGKKNKLFSLLALGGLKYSYITKYFMAARLFSNNASNIAYWHLDKIS